MGQIHSPPMHGMGQSMPAVMGYNPSPSVLQNMTRSSNPSLMHPEAKGNSAFISTVIKSGHFLMVNLIILTEFLAGYVNLHYVFPFWLNIWNLEIVKLKRKSISIS